MIIAERTVRIVVSDIVTGFRHHFFNLSDCPDIAKEFNEANAKLDGILLLFPEGKINRFILNYQRELLGLARLCGHPFIKPVFVHEPEYSFNDEYNQQGPGIADFMQCHSPD